jgi:hypothetical protein
MKISQSDHIDSVVKLGNEIKFEAAYVLDSSQSPIAGSYA